MAQPKVIIQARDETEVAFNSVHGRLLRMAAFAQRVNDRLGSIGTAGRNSLGSLLSPLRLIGAAFALISSLIGTVLGSLAGLTRAVLGAAQAIGGALWSGVSRVFGYLATTGKVAVLGLAAAMGMLAKRGVDVNLSLAGTERGLAVMLKSASAAKALVAGMRELAENSVSQFVDIAGYGRQLVAFRFGVMQVLPMLRILGDTVAGLSGGPEMMSRLILAFGQMKAKGFLQGEEVMQLLEAGVPARDYLERAGLLKVGQDIARARIGSMAGIQAILAGMGNDFGGMQAGAMSTLPGILSNMGDAFDRLSAKVTTGLLASLTRAAKTALDFVSNLDKTRQGQRLLQILERSFNTVGRAIEGLAGRIPYFIGRLVNFLDSGRLRSFGEWAMRTFGTMKTAAQQAVGWLSDNWGPIWNGVKSTAVGALKLIVGAIYGLLAVYREWDSRHGSIGEKLQSLAESAKQFGIVALSALKPLLVKTAEWIGLIGTALLALKMGMIGATVGAAVGGPYGAVLGAAAMVPIGAAIGKRLADQMTLGITRGLNRAIAGLYALDTSKVAAGFGKGLPSLGQGTFANGFRQGMAAVDAFLAPPPVARAMANSMGPVGAPIPTPGMPTSPGTFYVPSERLRPRGQGGSWRERNTRGSDLGADPAGEAARHLESAAAAIRRMPRAAQEAATRELSIAYGGTWG